MLRVLPLLLVVAVAGSALPGSAPGQPQDYVVGFTTLPAERGHFAGGAVVGADEALRFLVVRASEAGFAHRAAGEPGVRYVEADEERMHALLVPNDTFYASYQYAMKPAAVDLERAWDLGLGSSAVKVCVADTGQDRSHLDLQGVAWAGWRDFVRGKAQPYDDNGHGTHVTGTLAAVTDNGRGVAGAAQAAVLGAKVLGRTGSGSVSGVASGIAWCADQGAHVVSLSLGGGFSAAIADAVRHARDTRGALVVAAAGNSGPCAGSCVGFPGALPEALAVACTDAANQRCSFSSQGPEVDLAAPGQDIPSTWPAGVQPCRKTDKDCYVLSSGTSMSTPLVAGLAALVKAREPGLGHEDLRARLVATARDLGPAGADASFGAGLVQGAAVG